MKPCPIFTPEPLVTASLGPSDVRLAVVAHTRGEDLAQARQLCARGLPRAVHAAGERGGHRLPGALVDLFVERAAGHRAGRAVDRDPLRARARRAAVEDAPPRVASPVLQR